MCGIAGIINLRGGRPIERRELAAMTDSIRHRGPDSDGFAIEDGVGLAFRRLAIIDVSGGDQPIVASDANAAIIFNGELYNYLEIRDELLAKGHRFTTKADTEVVLRGYIEWGEDALCRKLRGMFAFAIHDRKRRRTILVRDPLGKKPLHLHVRGDRLYFGSEIKEFLVDPEFPRALDPKAILDYATLGYVLRESSIFGAVEKLLPGTYAVVENGSIRKVRYWSAPFEPIEIDYSAAVERAAALVKDAVRCRLMSEVPLGCFLSGGLDSSLVVANMIEFSGTGLNAITVGFDETGFDERVAAREVARHVGIVAQEEVVHPDPKILDAIEFTFDEPHADPSAVPTYLLSRATRKRVTVALSGDGGDECFGGYRRYRFDLVENRVRSFVPRAMRAAIFGSLGRIWPKADFLPRPLRFKTLLENLARDPVEAYFRSVSRVRPEEAVAMLDPDLRAQIAGYRTVDRYYAIDKERKTSDPLARIRSLDFETWLPDDILVKVDRASMANSLEVRAPLLDARLVAFASGLPPEYLIAGGSGKRVLKDAARKFLPSEVIDRKKHGFDLPVKRWLAGPLAEEIDSLSRPGSSLAGRFDLARVASVTAEHRRGLRDRTAELWMLLMFSRFARRYADGRAT